MRQKEDDYWVKVTMNSKRLLVEIQNKKKTTNRWWIIEEEYMKEGSKVWADKIEKLWGKLKAA